MSNREPLDLSKMAISLFLVCLVVGITTGFFFLFFDKTDEKIDNMERATASASMERVYELEQEYLSNILAPDKWPLVTNVVSAITEFEEGDFLYITISESNGAADESRTYTYNGVNTTGMGGHTKDQSDIPVTKACKDLLQYSKYRCSVDLVQYDPGTGTIIDSGGLTGIIVRIWKTGE